MCCVRRCTCTAALALLQALEAVAEQLRGRRCRFAWGNNLAASWDRLVRDAALLQLLEERERLQAAIEDRKAAATTAGATGAAALAFLSGELECQLEDCESDMKAVLQGPLSPPVSATAFTARLLREQLPLAPVTLHAASRAALDGSVSVGIRQGQVLDDLRQQQELKGNLLGGFVHFQQPLSASPSLIHITATRPAWTLRLKELSERGMLVQISPLSPAGWKDTVLVGGPLQRHVAPQLTNLYAMQEDLQLAYCAGSAEGVQHIGPSKGIRVVQAAYLIDAPPLVPPACSLLCLRLCAGALHPPAHAHAGAGGFTDLHPSEKGRGRGRGPGRSFGSSREAA